LASSFFSSFSAAGLPAAPLMAAAAATLSAVSYFAAAALPSFTDFLMSAASFSAAIFLSFSAPAASAFF